MASPQQQEDLVTGQAAVFACIFGYIDTMALRCAVKLGIPDIISSHGGPISLTQLSKSIDHPSIDCCRLSRVMTILVRRGIFTATPSNSDTLYGATAASELLLVNTEQKSLAAKAMYHSSVFINSLWQELDERVKDVSSSFTTKMGTSGWSYLKANPEIYQLMQQQLAGISKCIIEALKAGYLHDGGLKGVGSLTDVAGGTGAFVGEIVKEFPHIKGTNLDLKAVIDFAPERPGVTHVVGDMLVSVPPADAIVIKQGNSCHFYLFSSNSKNKTS